MTDKNQIYKCEICGNIVEVLHNGKGELVCCGVAMKLIEEKTKDEGKEKHVPVFEKLPENLCRGGDGLKVRVGEVEHPMEIDHYIEWIEIKTVDNKVGKKFLKPGGKTEAEFHTRAGIVEVRAYCNIHGLWKSKIL